MDQNTILYAGIALLIIIITVVSIIIISRKKKKPIQLQNKSSSKEKIKKDNLQLKLAKTKNSFLGRIAEVLKLRGKVDSELMDDLEEVLIQADIGFETSAEIIERLKEVIRTEKIEDSSKIQQILEDIIKKILLEEYSHPQNHFQINSAKPFVILFVGVNGVGKTTTIGKLATRYIKQGKSVMMIAGDTFRAAAIEQLTIWAERAGAFISKQKQGSDPSSVIYDGLVSAKTKKMDVVLIDTAGRQHTKVNLMNELSKVVRTIKKVIPNAPHESLLVVDSTTGQNALTQANMFHQATNLSGLVLTKLDGTAKGGIVIGIKHQLDLPVKLIGVGEKQEDLRDFDVKEFVEAIFE